MLRAMIIKEMLLVLRDKHALAAIFIMPAIFVLIMSVALRDTLDGTPPPLNYVLINLDNSPEADLLDHLLANYEADMLVRKERIGHDADALRQRLHGGDLQFILTIPQGFSARLCTGNKAPLLDMEIAADAEKGLIALFIARLNGELQKVRLQKLADTMRQLAPQAAALLRQAASENQVMIRTRYTGSPDGKKPNSTQQSVPAWIAFGMFFIIIPLSTVFIGERTQHTLKRMHSMNVSIPWLVLGKILPYMLINQIQAVLMILVGMYVAPLCGAPPLAPGNSPGGLILVSLGLSLAAIGISLFISAWARTVAQATTVGGLINILLGALGGAMIPKFYMPPAMQSLASFSPMSWGIEGFLDIFLRGYGVTAVLGETAALVLFGGIMICLTWLMLAWQFKKGTL